MTLRGVLLAATLAVVSVALVVVSPLLSLFSRGEDDDPPSSGLPRTYARPSQERRPLRDYSPCYQSYSGPRVASSHQQPPAVSERVDRRSHQAPSTAWVYGVPPGQRLARDFLPIYNRQDYEAARAEAERLLRLEKKHLSKKERAERRGDSYHTHRYEQLIESQRQTIDVLNAEASEWIYQENNRSGKLPADSVDLHGLKVAEAIEYARMAIRDAEERGKHKVRLIVGKGKHSEGGASKLKPAIQKEFRSQGLDVETDPRNAGRLIVRLSDSQIDMV